MSILSGLSLVVFPIAEFSGGHIFEVGGYEPVYITSLIICTCGLLYVILVVPKEATENTGQIADTMKNIVQDNSHGKCDKAFEKEVNTKSNNKNETPSFVQTLKSLLMKGNTTIIESYR